MPRKSRMRGMATVTRRSRNSYMRWPRSVTMQPTGKSLRTLKVAIDFFALVTTGFCPAILVRSATALSRIFLSWVVSPTPMLSVIFLIRGTCIVVLYPNFFISSGTTSLRSYSCSRAISGIHHFAVGLEHADLAPVLHQLEADAVGLLRLRVEQRDVGDVDRHVLVDDASGLVLHRVRPLVFLDAVHSL